MSGSHTDLAEGETEQMWVLLWSTAGSGRGAKEMGSSACCGCGFSSLVQDRKQLEQRRF